ncbi:hypothetical protein A0H81_05968 [Grifola frondosa]|uniref:Translocation protein sec72 n=1 Tax=Grifola frondosa TaxID=5627 RepID=A0A1C7MC84_GRIFR|nr:hypothetical protein A0H81_05968 [Grifola frondosa]
MAASIAVQRPPWEAQVYMREELSTVLSNRSAAFVESGHFRKARALMKLDRYQEAKEAMQLGLSFEPNNQEMIQLLADIESVLKTKHTIKYPSSSEKTAPAPLPIPVS